MASVRTTVYWPAPSAVSSARSTAAATASVLAVLVAASAPIRARIVNAVSAPNVWISAPRIPAASSACRRSAVVTRLGVSIWTSVPPVNSML